MDGIDLDFEGTQQKSGNDAVSASSDNQNNNQNDTTHLNGGGVDDVTGKDNNNQQNANNNNAGDGSQGNENNNDNQNNDNQQHDLPSGTIVDVDGTNYTINEKGELIDDKGNVFKSADEVKALLDENDVNDSDKENKELTLDSIQEALGVEITDEDGKRVEFSNDADGVTAYINEVIEHRLAEVSEGAVAKLFNDNPVLADFYNYYTVNGTAQGFGEMPDRRGWQLDKDNEAQLEQVIKIAAREFGNKSLNDNYIKYLKSTGALYDEAKLQLEALQAADEERRETMAREVKEYQAAQEEQNRIFQQNLKNTINSKTLAGYKIPDNIVKEVNGKKITYSLEDFYDYVVTPNVVLQDGRRITGYDRDRTSVDPQQKLENELLVAWLSFTGGSLKDLVNMAIKEENVRKLVLKSKENRNKHTIKVVKPKSEKVSAEDILF